MLHREKWWQMRRSETETRFHHHFSLQPTKSLNLSTASLNSLHDVMMVKDCEVVHSQQKPHELWIRQNMGCNLRSDTYQGVNLRPGVVVRLNESYSEASTIMLGTWWTQKILVILSVIHHDHIPPSVLFFLPFVSASSQGFFSLSSWPGSLLAY